MALLSVASLGHETEIGPGDSVAQLDRPVMLHDADNCIKYVNLHIIFITVPNGFEWMG